MKRPAFQFYPGDWLRDTALRSCSVGARGLWIEMICLMHEGEPYGHLSVNNRGIAPETLARMIGATTRETMGWLRELEDAGVFSRTDQLVIYSRRMVKDEETRNKRAAGGSKSLSNPNVPRPKKGSTKGYPSGGPSGDPLQGSLGGSPASASASASATDNGSASKDAGGEPRPSFPQNGDNAQPTPWNRVLFPALRESGFAADARDGRLCKDLVKTKKVAVAELEAAIRGLRLLRDSGKLVRSLNVQRGDELNMRMLVAEVGDGYAVLPIWREAENEYHRELGKQGSKGPARVAVEVKRTA